MFGAGGLIAVITSACQALFDGNPATNPDWTSVIGVVSICIGLFFARDNKVSTEQVQAANKV